MFLLAIASAKTRRFCMNSLRRKLVSAVGKCTCVDQIKRIHGRVLVAGLGQCCVVLAKLIRRLAELGVPMETYARVVFERVEDPNPFLWTALIRGYALQGCVAESVGFYGGMRRAGSRPLSFTFSALLKACAGVGDVSLGRELHAQTVLVGGFGSDLYVGNTLIAMYAKCGSLECARKMFDEMPERDVVSWTELIVAYGKSGDMEMAEGLFNELPVKDRVAWTAMVTGYAQNARPREALDVFKRMQDAGVETDDVTLMGVISACAMLGASKFANWIRIVAETSGLGPCKNVFVGSAMVDMYFKCGNLDDAINVFEAMKERNVFSYSSMIMGLAMYGRGSTAMQMFHDMLKSGIRPNHVTFVGLLTACSHVGLVEQGRGLFAAMENHYGVTPSIEHYSCLVDLLGRAGELEEALWVIETMPMEPNGAVWGALLAACRTHRNPNIAQLAADHLFELEPNLIGNYMLLSNIYASAEMWDEVSRVRKLVRERGIKKNPGCSWVEAKRGEIHEFVSDDATYPMSAEIRQALEDLLNWLEARGYESNLSSVVYNISDKEKKRLLMTHSEKLALAYGLVTTGPGCTIKIMKNLRICEDCHTFMCGVSLITGREIVIRDNMRFHQFQNGTCSCGNYW